MEKVSYSLGVLVGNNLKSQVIPGDIDVQELARGIEAVLKGGELELDVQQANQNAQLYMQQITNKLAAQAMMEEQKFFDENGKREEIVTRTSGLQYEVLVEGTGRQPKLTDNVTVHYEGKLLDGSIFDSSVKRGQPATFKPSQLIKGWQEALQLMPAGSKWRLYIPSRLGYGTRGAGADIPPNATLVFDLELISVR